MQRARSFPRPRSPMRLYLPAAATMRRRASIISAAVASTRQRGGLSPGPPAGDGATPVTLIAERAAADNGHLLPPADQTRAGPAHGLARDEFVKRGRAAGELPDLVRTTRDRRI